MARIRDLEQSHSQNSVNMAASALALGVSSGTGAIVGAVLGARFGLAAIPERWRRRVAGIRAGREPMERLADRLAAASGVSG